MTNPLLEQAGLPAFSVIRPEHVEPAIDRLLADNRARIAELLDGEQAPTWANLVQPIELLDDRLGRAWSPVGHLNSVMDTPELRAAYNACLPKLSAYHTELGHNHRLYLAYKAVAEGGEDLNAAQRKLLENALRDFHLSGVDLPPQRKARFKEISQRLSQLSSRFQENVLDANHAWSKRVEDVSALAGLPDSALDLMRQTAAEREQDGWLLTLDFPLYYPVVTYADDRELRREVYEAYVTRASERGPHGGQWDNGPVMEEMLALRHEMGGLLGFVNYAELSLATKMAGDTAQVLDFLRDLARRSRAQGERELAELQQFALEQGGPSPLESWDVSYYSEKLRQARYSISQEELRPYFPAPRVIDGLFAVAHRLFGITIKRGGAWMDGCTDRLFTDDCDQLPAAYLTCNFTPPVGERPSLLTHDEVQTLFHEFGHGLHHMLTRVDYPAVGGINGVAWDAVELPSQLLENWCWEKPALDLMARHWESGAPLPEQLFQRMRAAKNFQSAMQMLRQLEFALFDFRLHLEYDPAAGPGIYPLLQQVRDEVSVLRPPEFNRFPHSFGHVFSGGYAAGYYSYKWAEVLSADAFSLFEERGVFDQDAGRSFMENVLERGGSAEPGELFRAFRGRDPSIEPLLRHSGIAP